MSLHLVIKKLIAAALNNWISFPTMLRIHHRKGQSRHRRKEWTLSWKLTKRMMLLQRPYRHHISHAGIIEQDPDGVCRVTLVEAPAATLYAINAYWRWFFIKAVYELICYSMRYYWRTRNNATLHTIGRQATSLANLWNNSNLVGSLRSSDKRTPQTKNKGRKNNIMMCQPTNTLSSLHSLRQKVYAGSYDTITNSPTLFPQSTVIFDETVLDIKFLGHSFGQYN